MKNKLLALTLITLLFASCSLNELPKDRSTESNVINTEDGLNTYVNGFYKILPDGEAVFTGDNLSDIVAVTSVNDFIKKGVYNPRVANGWSWDNLRNVNFFLDIINGSTLSPEVLNNYRGVARFFRAYFYFDKVKRFGDVPFYNKAYAYNDPALFNPRDSRTLVMDSVLMDINYAINNIDKNIDPSATQITRSVALAYKSRICLFEGTYRKYHTDLGLQASANMWLDESAKAAKMLIDENKYRLYTAKGADASYRSLFTSVAPLSQEVMLSFVCDAKLNIYTAANRRYISPTYGDRPSLTRQFVNTYLKLDGTPFTNDPNYKTQAFAEEVKSRDTRLKQTIRLGDYKRTSNGVPEVAAPSFATTYTGYQPIKWSYDEKMPFDDESLNDNSISLIRFAEVLLNYAEAKAELGTLTAADWQMTVGALRSRAGITGASLSSLPTVVDPYLQKLYPMVSNPIILEIRRERAIELALEGFRFDDIRRWKAGDLMNTDYDGIYVKALDTPMDLNEDGLFDVVFFKGSDAPVFPDTPQYAQMVKVRVDEKMGENAEKQRFYLSESTSGELIRYSGEKDFQNKNYLYPVPQYDRDINSKLTQNEGW